ncbi:MAG: LysR family transcriptional regulator [Emergencia sp.]
MELLQLKYFLAAAGFEHMTKAAESLHIAQPALSQAIRRLEKELDTTLFVRQGRGIRLTEQGKLLADRLQPLMQSLDELPGLLQEEQAAAARTIRVSILSASELVTKLIIRYKELHPDVIFQLSQNPDADDWDVRISTVTPLRQPEDSHTVLQEEIFLAVPVDSPFASSDSVRLQDVRRASFISLEKSKPFSVLTAGYCMSCGFSPQIVFESDSPATVRNLIGAGLGVAFWPAYSWGPQKSPKVRLLHIAEPVCTRQIYVARRIEKPSSGLKDDFYQFVSSYFLDLQTI